MKKQLFLTTTAIAALGFYTSYATAKEANDGLKVSAHAGHILADSHGPIGVMGGHTHKKGEVMVSYRFGAMHMEGNRSGTSRISNAQARASGGFAVVPIEMNMQMHMFGAMYGVSDKLTVMAMGSYQERSMNHETGMLTRFQTESRGFGDTRVSGLYTLFEEGDRHEDVKRAVHVTAGLSLPTGSINRRDNTPMGNQVLPYPMQLGSGTYDPILGITYTEQRATWSWGAQASTTQRVHDNSQDYRLGDEYQTTAWIAKNVHENASLSFRLDGRVNGDISGTDDRLNPAVVPTARADLRAGERVDALVGINLVGTEGRADGHRLAFEFGLPIYQRLDGPQLETDYRFTLGYQFNF